MAYTQLQIRKGQLTDLIELQQLFVETVRTVCKVNYNRHQIDVWAASVDNKLRWLAIIEQQFLLVACHQEKIVGFCSLTQLGCIDMLYVHKDWQRRGVAAQLYSAIEKEAKQNGHKRLISEVSITAKPFFERVGFSIETEQTVVRNEVELTNYKMVKGLM
ncbi:MAG: GNAT family N-acetyltransferase [Bacteroidetes bacterium]|nr:GNAT family N-acetyltransferase [Bacteroidota bacterium]